MSTTHASPWDALLRPHKIVEDAARFEWQYIEADAPQQARPGTKVARLLAELAQVESATTLSLCVRTDLDFRQVWGLLKAPRASGQVTFSAGRWALNRDWRGRDIERAAALLRNAGWRVTPPADGGSNPCA